MKERGEGREIIKREREGECKAMELGKREYGQKKGWTVSKSKRERERKK
jgi:hypothetical protein